MRRYQNLSWPQILCALSFAYDNEEVIEADLVREQELLDAMDQELLDTMVDKAHLPNTQIKIPFPGESKGNRK